MGQDTKPAPFNVGDHVRYIGSRKHSLQSGTEPVLVKDMEGVILISTGMLSEEGETAPNPWHCRVQFQNGFQFDITPANIGDFEMA